MRGKNCTTRNKNNRVRVQRRKGGGAGGHRLSSFNGRQVQPIWRDFPPASVARGRDDTVESACLLAKTFGVPTDPLKQRTLQRAVVVAENIPKRDTVLLPSQAKLVRRSS